MPDRNTASDEASCTGCGHTRCSAFRSRFLEIIKAQLWFLFFYLFQPVALVNYYATCSYLPERVLHSKSLGSYCEERAFHVISYARYAG